MTEQDPLPVGPVVEAGDAARAELYVLLGTLLAGPPDEAILEMLLEIDAGEAAATPMTAIWQSLQAAVRATDPEQLADEYFRLFIGLGRGELVPYASFYIHGFLMEKVLASLRSELQRLGFELQEGSFRAGRSRGRPVRDHGDDNFRIWSILGRTVGVFQDLYRELDGGVFR